MPGLPPGYIAFLADDNTKPSATADYPLPPAPNADGSDKGKSLRVGPNGLSYSDQWKVDCQYSTLVNAYDAGAQPWEFSDNLVIMDSTIRWYNEDEGDQYFNTRHFKINQGGLSFTQEAYKMSGGVKTVFSEPSTTGNVGNLQIGRNLKQGAVSQQCTQLGADCVISENGYAIHQLGENLTVTDDTQAEYIFMTGRNKLATTKRRAYFAMDNGIWLQPRNVDVTTPEAGVMTFDSRFGRLRVHDGTAFLPTNQFPSAPKSANYTFTLGDANTQKVHPATDATARTFTIPANATVPYPIGTELRLFNQHGAGTLTLTITTDTMRVAGTGTTGNITIAQDGYAIAYKIAATEWLVDGKGLT